MITRVIAVTAMVDIFNESATNSAELSWRKIRKGFDVSVYSVKVT